MKIETPNLPSGKNAPRQVAHDFLLVSYLGVLVVGASAAIAWARRKAKEQAAKRGVNASPGQTAAPTASLFTV